MMDFFVPRSIENVDVRHLPPFLPVDTGLPEEEYVACVALVNVGKVALMSRLRQLIPPLVEHGILLWSRLVVCNSLGVSLVWMLITMRCCSQNGLVRVT